MRAVILRPPSSLLEARRRTGADLRDEMWEGILHMVPPPSSWHQRFSSELFQLLAPVAKSKGLQPLFETGLFRPDSDEPDLDDPRSASPPGPLRPDVRVPDLLFARPERLSERGVEGGAELVVELLSEGDESREKLGFYEQLGVGEALLIDPDTREVELYALRGGRLHLVLPDEKGAIRLHLLGVALGKAAGPKLALAWPEGNAEL